MPQRTTAKGRNLGLTVVREQLLLFISLLRLRPAGFFYFAPMELINKENLLPVSLEELAEFVLVGRPKLDMVRAGIRAIDKLGVADGVRKQKIEEAQMLAEALLDAEVRIGYLFGRMAKAKPGPEKIRDSGVPQPKETKEAAIERIGFNKKQAQRFEALAANPDIVEEVKQEARENDDLATRSAALKLIKERRRQQEIERQKEEIAQAPTSVPSGLFDVVVVDPPWNYGREYDPESSRVANPYPEMSQHELLSLEIPSAENCVMWLWTTHQFIWDAKELLDEWGFTYKACLTWNKEKIGMGHWLRMQCEFCLLAVKGKPVWDNTSFRDIISEPRREHSRKPEAFYEMVNAICYGSKLDYFSRQEREGWSVFGNDVKKFGDGLAG